MASNNTDKELLILGVHLKTEGYPNTLYRVRDLMSCDLFDAEEINAPMWSQNTRGKRGLPRLVKSLWQALASHISVIGRYMLSKRSRRLYIPYPSVFVLFILSLLPEKARPYIVADIFISLYDTVVLDRHLLKPNSWPARLLKWIERRAYRHADKLIVDTPQNKQFLSELFDLPVAKFVAIPLSTNETQFAYRPYTPSPAPTCKVLFIGTLVPLHGIGIILEAIRLLSGESNIRFKLIGDGQDAYLIEAWKKKYGIDIDWERAWQSSSQLATEIDHADICLGIFGGGDKTQRVCPFKIYAYASMGRPIITGLTRWMLEATEDLSQDTMIGVPVADAESLAAKIKMLASSPELRSTLAQNSKAYYQEHLTNQFALEKLAACILAPPPSSTGF